MTGFLLITTGGTMDAEPYAIEDTPEVVTPLVNSLVPDMLHQMQCGEFEHCALPPADSKVFLADGERLNQLIEAIIETPHNRVLVTHGTDALAVMAVAVYQALKAAASDKRVVFSCAMTPLANSCDGDGVCDFADSDGYQNTQRAIAELRRDDLPMGAYIAANEGTFFEGNETLPRIRKEFNTQSPAQRYFYVEG